MKESIFSGIPTWVRWILIIPCAVFAWSLVDICITNLFTSGTDAYGTPQDPAIGRKLAGILCAFFCPIVYLKTGYILSPAYKRGCAMVLLVLAIIAIGYRVSNFLYDNGFGIYYVLKHAASVVFLIAGYYNLKPNETVLSGQR